MIETVDFTPTLKRYSFLVSAEAQAVRATTSTITNLVACRLRSIDISILKLLPAIRAGGCQTLWQRTIQSHLINHGFLSIGVHQRLLSLFIVWIGIDRILRILDVGVPVLEIALVGLAHRGRAHCDLLQELLIIWIGGGNCDSWSNRVLRLLSGRGCRPI